MQLYHSIDSRTFLSSENVASGLLMIQALPIAREKPTESCMDMIPAARCASFMGCLDVVVFR